MSESSDVFTWAARSDVGRVREVNQDSAHATEQLFVVADGMGGHRGGEVASAVAVEVMAEDVTEPFTLDELVQRVRDANSAIIARAADNQDLAGMGTTLCALAPLGGDATSGLVLGLVNVGDSRIYRFADDHLEQVSEDHSLVGTLFREGHLTAEEAAVHPQRNIVTRALGIATDVEVDSWELLARRGERYILCSDGLVDEVSDNQISAALRRLADPGEVADELVRLANENGARDNVTVLVLRVDAGPTGVADPVESSFREGVEAVAEVDDASPPHDEFEYFAERVIPRGGRFRAAISVAAVIIIFGAGLILTGLYARNNYYVAFEQEQVVIYQGRPGGVLWFDPTVAEPTAFLRSDLTSALELEIDANPEFGTISEAQSYVEDLTARIDVSSVGG